MIIGMVCPWIGHWKGILGRTLAIRDTMEEDF